MTSDVHQFERLREISLRFAVEGEFADTVVQGLRVHSCSEPTAPVHAAYGPTLHLVLQGSKKLKLGAYEYHYGVGQYLLTSVDLPVTTWVLEATGEAPYVCLALDLRLEAIRNFPDLINKKQASSVQPSAQALSVQDVSPRLLNALCRFMELLETPEDVPTLAPLIEQEILYRLLHGPDGAMLMAMAAVDSHSNRISRAVNWIRANFDQPLEMDRLLDDVGMSSSSFHRHFRAVTAFAPLEFQKRLRLHEARRLMIVDGMGAGEAGFRVGYQSQSQFGREYVRLYGTTPAKDRRITQPRRPGKTNRVSTGET